MYEASLTLAYETPVNVSNPLSGGTGYFNQSTAGVEVQGVGSAVLNPEIKDRVRTLVGDDVVDAAPYQVSGEAQKSDPDAIYTNLAKLSVRGSDAEQAATLANAYAKAIIETRIERQQELIKRAEQALEGKLKSFTDPATHVSPDYILLKQRLQDLQILAATLTGDFRVVVPATTPQTPYEPQPLRSAVLGFGIGLFVGVGLAFLLEQLDTRLKDYREAAEILRLPVVGRIPRVPKQTLREHPIMVVDQSSGRTAESFRLLRGNLEFMNVDQDIRSLFVASCLPGEGKSITIANLAASLALGGKKVLLLDGDLRKPSLHRFFGLTNDEGLSTVLVGKTSVDEALQEAALLPQSSTGGNGSTPSTGDDVAGFKLDFLAAGPPPPNPGELIASKRFASLIEELQGRYDLVLVDTPAMMAVGDVAALASSIESLLMLVDFEVVTRSTLREARDIVEPLPCRKLGIIAAQERVSKREAYSYGYYGYGSTKAQS
jgi:Mrp family chromosome partitioning ATPase